MRRAITEWGLVFTSVVVVGILGLWLDSRCHAIFDEPLYLGTDLFVRFADDRLCLFSQLGRDWKPVLEDIARAPKPKAISMSWARIYNNWFFPGIEYHNRLFASGRTVWSVEVSVWLLLGLVLTLIAVLWRVRCGGWLPRRSASL
jgi:hypothetical protein